MRVDASFPPYPHSKVRMGGSGRMEISIVDVVQLVLVLLTCLGVLLFSVRF